MVENIHMPKQLSPLSFTAKVKNVKHDKEDMNRRQFEKQLKEEGEEKNGKQEGRPKSQETAYENHATGDNIEDKGTKKKVSIDDKEDSDSTYGRLLDIIV